MLLKATPSRCGITWGDTIEDVLIKSQYTGNAIPVIDTEAAQFHVVLDATEDCQEYIARVLGEDNASKVIKTPFYTFDLEGNSLEEVALYTEVPADSLNSVVVDYCHRIGAYYGSVVQYIERGYWDWTLEDTGISVVSFDGNAEGSMFVSLIYYRLE